MSLLFIPKVLRTPSWVVILRLDSYCPDFDELDLGMYIPFKRTPAITTTSLDGNHHSKCNPSPIMQLHFDRVKYGDGMNVYWNVIWHDVRKRNKARKIGNSKGGKATKETAPTKKRGNSISDAELKKRAKGTGKQARNARMLLKQREKRLK